MKSIYDLVMEMLNLEIQLSREEILAILDPAPVVTMSNGTKNLGHFKQEYNCTSVVKYTVGDKVHITEQWDDNYNKEGTITRYEKDDDSYLIEFESVRPRGISRNTEWYYGSKDFELVKPKLSENHCWHEWKEDMWFTSKVFKTCKNCNKRFEDV